MRFFVLSLFRRNFVSPKANSYAVRIGGSERAVPDRRPNRAFLRSRKSAFSIPTFSIEQSDPRIPSKKSTCSTGCTDRIVRSKKFLNPTASLTTPENTRSHPTKQLRDAGLTATAAAAAAHSESAWQMLFSARQQRVPASDRSSACYR